MNKLPQRYCYYYRQLSLPLSIIHALDTVANAFSLTLSYYNKTLKLLIYKTPL
uniref:Auxin-responsive protein n=1 Tax=Rhizophora mucronata TaxID=61149 RepID=A0A2P2JYP9_RHIMU